MGADCIEVKVGRVEVAEACDILAAQEAGNVVTDTCVVVSMGVAKAMAS